MSSKDRLIEQLDKSGIMKTEQAKKDRITARVAHALNLEFKRQMDAEPLHGLRAPTNWFKHGGKINLTEMAQIAIDEYEKVSKW